MVFRIDDVDAAAAVHCERPGAMQLSGGPPGPAPHAERPALRRELLYAMVLVLDHVQFAVLPEGEIIWI
jgi:hypothetical protein